MLEKQRRMPMATIQQKQLFVWNDLENLGDLERLKLVLDYIPDEKLVTKLEEQRNNGRDKYPVRAVWNSILAGVVYQHISIESLRRELLRNAQLRQICGFDVLSGIKSVPTSMAYSRFLKNLLENESLIKEMFNTLVSMLKELLPDLGKYLAFDGKGIESIANGSKKRDVLKLTDRRSDSDADWGVKKYSGKRPDGSMWSKVKSWFGYRLHLIVDAKYELPISYEVTKASKAEGPVIDKLFSGLYEKHEDILEKCDYAIGDRGYDDGKRITYLWDKCKIKPVIDIRNQWKYKDETKIITGYWNAVYNFKGDVFCVCPKTGCMRSMAFGGFEKRRECLKYRCPAIHYGLECDGIEVCSLGKSIRVSLSENRRIFTPIARSSYKWKKIYKMRTSTERVNSRLDVSFGFENHFIRGLSKMKARCGIALCVMLSMALGRIKEKKEDLIRSLVKRA
jgi:hypothetical protein